MSTQQKCQKHEKQFNRICLSQDCQNYFLLCEQCDISAHKHSKTQIQQIKNIKDKLKEKWQLKQPIVDSYIKKSRIFYDSLRKQINKLIDEDQKTVENILNKVKYHHLPEQANSMAFIEFMKSQYDRLDKNSIVTLINQAENGQLNKDMEKQKQILNYLDLELKKINDKVLTLKYVLLSKKLQTQMLIPHLSQSSLCASNQQFIKIYSLFNSRNMLIRSVKLIYRASQNDFQPSSFQNRCAGINNCLTIVKTKENKVFGGFSPIPLSNYSQQSQQTQQQQFQKDITKKSFIFSINNLRSYSLKDSNKAIRYKKNNSGPSFGVDLDINNVVTSNIGHSYESPPGVQVDSLEAKVFLLQSDKAEINDFQIWQISF